VESTGYFEKMKVIIFRNLGLSNSRKKGADFSRTKNGHDRA